MRLAILKLKYETPDTEKIMGVEYYQAVIQDGVRSYPEFEEWRRLHPAVGVVEGCLRQTGSFGKSAYGLINLVVRFPVPSEWLRWNFAHLICVTDSAGEY